RLQQKIRELVEQRLKIDRISSFRAELRVSVEAHDSNIQPGHAAWIISAEWLTPTPARRLRARVHDRSIPSERCRSTGTSGCSGRARRFRSSERGCSRWGRDGWPSSVLRALFSSESSPRREVFPFSYCRSTAESSLIGTASSGSWSSARHC